MMTQTLKAEGSAVDRKRVQRLMRLMATLESTAPKPNTSKPAPAGHAVYPYLLRNLTVSRINQVWAADIDIHPDGARFRIPGERSSIGIRGGCSPGACPTRWRRPSAERGSERSCWHATVAQRYSTRTRALSSPRRSSPVYCLLLRSRSAWMAKVAVSTTSSWSGSGAR